MENTDAEGDMSMEYSKLIRDLALPGNIPEELEKLREVAMAHEQQALLLTDIRTAEAGYHALNEALGKDEMAMLACQLWAAAKTRNRWLEKGISDRIFLDTMGCYRRFLSEAVKKTGRLYFDRGWWTYRQLSMVLFRIGQLEYELSGDQKNISVHIPSDACIAPSEVDASLTQAREFLKEVLPAYADCPMICDSWLLSPELAKILPEDSRILAFQRRFRIHEFHPKAMDCLEWLFSAPEDTPLEDLREDTSLQRKVKHILLNGGHIGVAFGTME